MTNDKDIDSINNLIFEHREKGYGAYMLRKQYKRVLITSAIAVNTFFALLFFSILLYTKYSQYNEFTSIEGVDIEYYSLDTLLQVENVILKQKPDAPTIIASNNFQVSDSTNNDTSIVQKKPDKLDSLSTRADSTEKTIITEKTDSVINKTYTKVDVMPEFPGGKMALYYYIKGHTTYSESELKTNTYGMVIVAFCIDENGAITNASIKKNLHPILDSAVIRTIRSMPRWIPGKNNNRNVKVLIHIPIVFSCKSK